MLTRREFISILMVMGALFFLFQFMNVIRQKWSSNIQNLYARKKDTLKSAASVYRAPESSERSIIYLGEEGSEAEKITKDWAYYQKWAANSLDSFCALEKQCRAEALRPQLVVADVRDAVWNQTDEQESFRFLLEQGVHVIVPALPSLAVLEQNEKLRHLLGIAKIRERYIQAKGIDLYEGFLLGGEAIYCAETEKDKKRQDLTLEMPWFTLTSGTKVYMKAMLKDPDVDVQEEPPILWRKSSGNGFVFLVNGDYFQGIVGLGLLSAMLHETQEVTIYPIVNAQNLIMGNAPAFADENNAVFQQRYSQSIRGALRDVIWASISRVSMDGIFGLTCLAAPQMDYSDTNEPQQKDLTYYLRVLQTLGGEMGLSGWQHSSVPIAEKLKKDADFWNVQASGYPIASFYQADLSEAELRQALAQPLLQDVQTVIQKKDNGSAPIGYQTELVTRQKAIADGFSFSYLDDLRVKSAETALGYTSVLTDMNRVFYPQTQEDGWETRSEEFSSNVITYWKPFSGFAKATTAQSDVRIRDFLALHYTTQTNGKLIDLNVESAGSVSFLVRSHEEELTQVEGGTFQQLEPGVWIVEPSESHAVLRIGKAEQRYYTP